MIQNFLSNKKFEFSIKRLPNTVFYVQNINIPGIDGNYTPMATPFSEIKRHGDKLVYDDLIVTVRMDENLEIYKEIHKWIHSLTKPKAYENYNLKTQREVQTSRILNDDDLIYSDASLFILNSTGNVNLEFRFTDIFPSSISSMQLTTTSTDTEYVTCDINFKYTYFTIVDEYL